MPGSLQAALLILVTIAAWNDLRTRRIPNWVTVPGAAAGILLHAFRGGAAGTVDAIAGCVLGLAIFLVLHMVAGMGAGDVKLFGAVGAFVGPQALVTVFVFTALLGGMAALVLAVWRGRLRETLDKTRDALLSLVVLRKRPEGTLEAAASDSLRLPYGAVIAGATITLLLTLH